MKIRDLREPTLDNTVRERFSRLERDSCRQQKCISSSEIMRVFDSVGQTAFSIATKPMACRNSDGVGLAFKSTFIVHQTTIYTIMHVCVIVRGSMLVVLLKMALLIVSCAIFRLAVKARGIPFFLGSASRSRSWFCVQDTTVTMLLHDQLLSLVLCKYASIGPSANLGTISALRRLRTLICVTLALSLVPSCTHTYLYTPSLTSIEA